MIRGQSDIDQVSRGSEWYPSWAGIDAFQRSQPRGFFDGLRHQTAFLSRRRQRTFD